MSLPTPAYRSAPTDAEIDYLETLFAAAYHRELDQEENVWRTLPFFAATLALQLAGLTQIRDWVQDISGWLLWVAGSLLFAAALATSAALVFLAQSIWPTRFRYVTSEPELRNYIGSVRQSAIVSGSDPDDAALSAIRAARVLLVEQYAVTASVNRATSQNRANKRTRAGLATLASVFSVLVLVAFVVISKVHADERSLGPVRASDAGRRVMVLLRPTTHQSRTATTGQGGL